MDILSELEMGEMAAVTAAATKRRRYAAFLCLQGSGQGPRGPKRKKTTFSWAAHVASLTESDFRLRYRLDSAAFYELLALLIGRTWTTGPQKQDGWLKTLIVEL